MSATRRPLALLGFALVLLAACSGGETVLGERDGSVEGDAAIGDDVEHPDDTADLTDDAVDAEAEADVCVPDCEGRCGGDDDCGGTCSAECGEGEVCVTPPGECVTARGWVEVPGTSPTRRAATAMAYDSARGVVVLFGGEDHGALGDTWEYDGATWTQFATPTSPPARGEHQMVYDSTRGVVVMFGGLGVSAYLEDTWEYDGTTWTEVEAPPPPEHMNGTCYTMVYDPVRRVVVMACDTYCEGMLCGDGWHIHEYDGTTWSTTEQYGGPDARVGYFDSARGVVVFLGGGPGSYYLRVVRKWEYDGSTLTETDTTATWPPGGTIPPGMRGIPHAYDLARDTVVLFGGMMEGAAGPLADTWEYDGVSWTDVETATTPSARACHAMAYDSDRGVVVMFGGSGVAESLGDTWEYHGP